MPPEKCACGLEHHPSEIISVASFLDPITCLLDPDRVFEEARRLNHLDERRARRLVSLKAPNDSYVRNTILSKKEKMLELQREAERSKSIEYMRSFDRLHLENIKKETQKMNALYKAVRLPPTKEHAEELLIEDGEQQDK